MCRLRELLRLLNILRVDVLLLCLGFAFHPAESLAMFGKSGLKGVSMCGGKMTWGLRGMAGQIRCSLRTWLSSTASWAEYE